MKRTSLSKVGVLALLIAASPMAATASNMVTKSPPPTAVTTPVACSSLWNFLVTSCPLSWYGITVYGTLDAGVTWQSHSAPYNGSLPAGGAPCNTAAKATCIGTFDAISFAADWRFAAKFAAYAGFMFSQVNDGLANGYLIRNTIDPTVGLIFRF